tara:strand:+ start:748 stop:2712 length:1965 start_codon:yes stop_codon:yes gene_type:complete
LKRLVPDATHVDKLRSAVASVHKATIFATELLNMHLRRQLRDPAADMSCFFEPNWLLNAYNEVTAGKGKVKLVPELRQTRDECMPAFSPPDRAGLTQSMLYEARNLAAVAATNVWMHFQKRVLGHVRRAWAIEDPSTLTKEQRRKHRLELLQMATDVCRNPSAAHQSPEARHAWVAAERARLGIDAAVGDWGDKPLLYHLKTKPHRFLRAMALMSAEAEAGGGRAFALYPLRRTLVPRHVRFDQAALRSLFGAGASEYTKEHQKCKRQKLSQSSETEPPDELGLPPLQRDGAGCEGIDEAPSATPTVGQRRKRRSKDEMADEKRELFGGFVDLRAAGVSRHDSFDFAFTTDGVCARVQMRYKKHAAAAASAVPRRGIWAIDELKRTSRLEQLHVVGVDPGKRELVVGVDMDDARKMVRYTQQERARDLRSRQYADEAQRDKPQSVRDAEAELAGFHSRTADLGRFCSYCAKRHESLEECLAFYARLGHRQRRWKTAIKTQQSEEKLYKKIEALQPAGDARQIVLAYGSWGLVAGRAGAACNRGNPPCIGVGLMRKLSKRFVVSPTPEAYTSKTCCCCFGACGPWAEKEEQMGKSIRGLRRCTQRDCMTPLNRDKNGATNIGINFTRQFEGKPPVRSMSDEDLAFHRATLCLECE